MIAEWVRNLLRPLIANNRFKRVIQLSEACKYFDRRVWDHDWGNRIISEALASKGIGVLFSLSMFTRLIGSAGLVYPANCVEALTEAIFRYRDSAQIRETARDTRPLIGRTCV